MDYEDYRAVIEAVFPGLTKLLEGRGESVWRDWAIHSLFHSFHGDVLEIDRTPALIEPALVEALAVRLSDHPAGRILKFRHLWRRCPGAHAAWVPHEDLDPEASLARERLAQPAPSYRRERLQFNQRLPAPPPQSKPPSPQPKPTSLVDEDLDVLIKLLDNESEVLKRRAAAVELNRRGEHREIFKRPETEYREATGPEALATAVQMLNEPGIDPQHVHWLNQYVFRNTEDHSELLACCHIDLKNPATLFGLIYELLKRLKSSPPLSGKTAVECLLILLPSIDAKSGDIAGKVNMTYKIGFWADILKQLELNNELDDRTLGRIQDAILAHPHAGALAKRAAETGAFKEWAIKQAKERHREKTSWLPGCDRRLEWLRLLGEAKCAEHYDILVAAAESKNEDVKRTAEWTLRRHWPESEAAKRVFHQMEPAKMTPNNIKTLLLFHYPDPGVLVLCKEALRNRSDLAHLFPFFCAAGLQQEVISAKRDPHKPHAPLVMAESLVREQVWNEGRWAELSFEQLFAWFDVAALKDEILGHIREGEGWGSTYMIPVALYWSDCPDLMEALKISNDADHYRSGGWGGSSADALPLLTLLYGHQQKMKDYLWSQAGAGKPRALLECLRLEEPDEHLLARALECIKAHPVELADYTIDLLDWFQGAFEVEAKVKELLQTWMKQLENEKVVHSAQCIAKERFPDLLPTSMEERLAAGGPVRHHELWRIGALRDPEEVPFLMGIARDYKDDPDVFKRAMSALTQIVKSPREDLIGLARETLADDLLWYASADCLLTYFPGDEAVATQVMEAVPRDKWVLPFVTQRSLASTEAGRAWLLEYMEERVRMGSFEFPHNGSVLLKFLPQLIQGEFRKNPAIPPLLEKLETVQWFGPESLGPGRSWRALVDLLLQRADTPKARIALAEKMTHRSTPLLAQEAAKKWMILITTGDFRRKKMPHRTDENVRLFVELARSTQVPAIREEALYWLRFVREKHPPLENPEVDRLLKEET